MPFIGWASAVKPIQKLMRAISIPTAAVLFRRTGLQFFLADGPDVPHSPKAAPHQHASTLTSTSATTAPVASRASSATSSSQTATLSTTSSSNTTTTAASTSASGSRPSTSSKGLSQLPLLARMTVDVPERGEYFFSALRAFASRTCYANTGEQANPRLIEHWSCILFGFMGHISISAIVTAAGVPHAPTDSLKSKSTGTP